MQHVVAHIHSKKIEKMGLVIVVAPKIFPSHQSNTTLPKHKHTETNTTIHRTRIQNYRYTSFQIQ